MTARHPLDGNAIAADAHYGQGRAEDHDFCDRCGAPFSDDPARIDPNTCAVTQHPTLFMLCTDCGDDMEDDHDE